MEFENGHAARRVSIAIIENWAGRADGIAASCGARNAAARIYRPYRGERLNGLLRADALIISGGPQSVVTGKPWECEFLEAVFRAAAQFVDAQKPVLGICLGHQILARVLGGRVERADHLEVGVKRILRMNPRGHGNSPGEPALSSFVFHRDHVPDIPADCAHTFTSEGCPVEGFRHETLPVYGVQFHPEIGTAKALAVWEAWLKAAEKSPLPEETVQKISRDIMTFDEQAGRRMIRNFVSVVLSLQSRGAGVEGGLARPACANR